MPDLRAPKTARNPEPLVRRLAARLIPLLLPRMLRLVGWGAVIGLPAVVLGSRRFARLTKKYPITVVSTCLLLMAAGWAWNSVPSLQPYPHVHNHEYDYDSFDDFDEYSGMYPEFGPFPSDTTLLTGPGHPHDQAVSVQCEIKPLPARPTGITTAGFQQSRPATAPPSVTPVVWLTGKIEDVPFSSPRSDDSRFESPSRSASRLPSIRR